MKLADQVKKRVVRPEFEALSRPTCRGPHDDCYGFGGLDALFVLSVPRAGAAAVWMGMSDQPMFAINTRCLDVIDIDRLSIRTVDGKRR